MLSTTTLRMLNLLLLCLQAEIVHSSWSYAALGDSYASGDGAGSSRLLPGVGAKCARFTHSYPIQIASNSMGEVDVFQNLACAGAITSTVLYTQVPWIWDSDVVTMQVGGNEADFFSLLNECVQQWWPLSTCEDELNKAKSIIQSNRFMSGFDKLVAGAMRRVKPGAQVLVLGYARFFNAETEQCNKISFSKTNPDNLLSQEKRRQFNQIITMLNDVIRGATEAYGATYVDIDPVFDYHRFCEDGVTEPAPDVNWFFSDIGREASSTQEREFVGQHVLFNPFEGFLNLTRTFHPTTEGHAAIAKLIMQTLQLREEET